MKTMKWIKYFVFFICCWMCGDVLGNNVKISNIIYNPREVTSSKDTLHLSFTVSWDQAWKDDYNHDAVYVFLKYRKKSDAGKEWHPMYIKSCRVKDSRYSCELAPGALQDGNIGFYVYLNEKGNGTVEIPVEITWNIKSNSRGALTYSDVSGNAVLVSAFGIEMVRVPRGPFRAGDNLKDSKVFWRDYVPFPASADLINSDCDLFSPSGGDPYKVADHVGGSVGDTTSCWIPDPDADAEWEVNFGTNKVIRYIGICATQSSAVPQKWRLEAQASLFDEPEVIFEKSAADWIVATNSAYPIEQTIATGNTKGYAIYRLVFEGITGTLAVKSISMTDVDNPLIKDHTVLVDRDSLVLESKRNFGAQDGTAWNSGAVVKSDYPNGYKEFYAMKYELTQEQYASFLNTLTWAQQQALIPGLAAMEEGDYIFGPRRDTANCRNGIIVERKVAGLPMVFANNLNPENLSGNADDGQTLACNYLSLKDLQAYAAWSGLRPMTELEFEKLGRPLYSYTAIPQMGEYAWNSLGLDGAKNIRNVGSYREQADGNANYNGTVGGPLRNGVFAGSGTQNREACGVSYWGVFELSGNLAEPYYNVNAAGRVFKGKDFVAGHGNGYLTTAALPENANVASWPATPAAFALRGGDFESTDVHELSVSDRRYFQNYWKDVSERDSTVGVRLGRTCMENEVLKTVRNTLTLENGMIGDGVHVVYDTIVDGSNYIISGSGAAEAGPVYSVLWYKSEDDSQDWTLMEGFTDKDLTLTNVIGRFGEGGEMREYRYRRKIVTPQGESMAEIGLMVLDSTYHIDKSKAVLIYGTTNHGITVTTQSTNLEVTWIDLKTGKEIAATSSSSKSSYLRVSCDNFPDFRLGEDRDIAVHSTIFGHMQRKDTIRYKIPMPTYNFDQKSVELGDNNEGIILTTSHLTNVFWKDLTTDKSLTTSTSVMSSACRPKWENFDEPNLLEWRDVEVAMISIDGCYQFIDTVKMRLPDCERSNPFENDLVQNVTYSRNNTLEVTRTWKNNAAYQVWNVETNSGEITINSLGILSGLNSTICNVNVSLADFRCPDVIHKKAVKENYRDFAYTGGVQNVTLPKGNYTLECWGAQGGGWGTSNGGKGGHVSGDRSVTTGEKIYLYVGGMGQNSTSSVNNRDGAYYKGGWNGGGNGSGSRGPGGGGMSHISLVSTDNFVITMPTTTITISSSGSYTHVWYHNSSGCTYYNQKHTFTSSSSKPSKCGHCNHSCGTLYSTSGAPVTKTVNYSNIQTRTFNTSNVLLVAAGGGGGTTGGTSKSNGSYGIGTCGYYTRVNGNPRDEAGGGGGYYGGANISGDDASNAYAGTNYILSSLSSTINEYDKRTGNGLIRITVK